MNLSSQFHMNNREKESKMITAVLTGEVAKGRVKFNRHSTRRSIYTAPAIFFLVLSVLGILRGLAVPEVWRVVSYILP